MTHESTNFEWAEMITIFPANMIIETFTAQDLKVPQKTYQNHLIAFSQSDKEIKNITLQLYAV